jgi:cellobiose phosphorylase
MYQAAVHELLGLRRRGDTISVNPCVPAMWPGYSIDLRHGGTRYRIAVDNSVHRHGGVRLAMLDGVAVDPRAIPFVDDGRTHDIAIAIGVTALA